MKPPGQRGPVFLPNFFVVFRGKLWYGSVRIIFLNASLFRIQEV